MLLYMLSRLPMCEAVSHYKERFKNYFQLFIRSEIQMLLMPSQSDKTRNKIINLSKSNCHPVASSLEKSAK